MNLEGERLGVHCRLIRWEAQDLGLTRGLRETGARLESCFDTVLSTRFQECEYFGE